MEFRTKLSSHNLIFVLYSTARKQAQVPPTLREESPNHTLCENMVRNRLFLTSDPSGEYIKEMTKLNNQRITKSQNDTYFCAS